MTTLVKNKRATFDFEILDSFEAGVVLTGFEVKALRASRGSLEGARVVVRGGEAFLTGASIQPLQQNNVPSGYDPETARRLLVSKKELSLLIGLEATKGLTLIPISWYTKGRHIKLGFASVRGKKKYDKRESIKERESKREMERTLKRQ